MTVATGDAGTKVRRARAALAAAEAKTGVTAVARRLDRVAHRSGEVPDGVLGGSLAEIPAEAPAEPEAMGRLLPWPGAARPAAEIDPVWRAPREVAGEVADLVEPGCTVSVTGSTSTLFAVTAALWGPDEWGVVAGMPDAGLLAAAQAGLPLERLTVVPDLGPEPLRVVAGLLDAFGVVVLGPPPMSEGDRRRIEARVRYRHTRLLVAGDWPGARCAVRVGAVMYGGVGRGEGALTPIKVAAHLGRAANLWGPLSTEDLSA